MNEHFNKVRSYVLDLGYTIVKEDSSEGIIIISDESEGINNLVIGCEDPILVMEQFIVEVKTNNPDIYKNLLQKNRDIVHGAFVLDESASKVIFRDTLQLENLDLNELEGSINSLSLLLSEYSSELITYSKK